MPLVIVTVVRAGRGRFERHRRIARLTLPLWLYVNVTGVLIYFMLYVWFPFDGKVAKKKSGEDVEVRLFEKKNKLFGKIESDWK